MVWRKVAVLFKVVPDPEGVFKIGADGDLPGRDLPQVPSVFDENAIEAAVQIKEATGCRITVFCVGPAEAEPLLRRTLAMGADEAVLIEQDAGWDSLAAARLLAAALTDSGAFDLVLCGREAADTGAGLVGPYVAHALGMSFLTLASAITVEDGSLRVRRLCDGGYDVFLCRPPVVLTVSGEANRPRMPSVLKVLQVKKVPIKRLRLALETLPPLPGPATARVLARSTPSTVGNCAFIDGGNAAEKAAGLLAALRAEGALS
jgi:electron transfer flavoprotein alpha/beta subunit